MYRRASSLETLANLNANPGAQGDVQVDGFKIIGPDGDDLTLSDLELEVLEDDGIIVRSGRTIKLAPGKTVDDVCAVLNV